MNTKIKNFSIRLLATALMVGIGVGGTVWLLTSLIRPAEAAGVCREVILTHALIQGQSVFGAQQVYARACQRGNKWYLE